MRMLILHPNDRINLHRNHLSWDLVVDLGRAATSTYDAWRQNLDCPIIRVSDFAEEVADLARAKSLLQVGMGYLVDYLGIDWWGVLTQEILAALQQLILIHRLAGFINRDCDIYSTRPDYRSLAIHGLLGGQLHNLESSFQTKLRRLRHYSEVASTFSPNQIFQIAQDKFDREHAIRSRVVKRGSRSHQPSIVLPSAYSNVSHTALAFASLLPDEKFLLICVRDSAKVNGLPANVQLKSLDPYFSSPGYGEISPMLEKWSALKNHLIQSTPEYKSAAAVGIFDRIPSLIKWGIAVRNAWMRLFDSEKISACLSADLSNSYTRIPLLLAKQAGIPSIGCHHGALDAWMAVTTHDADFYLAKSEMEHDYMTRVCGIPPAKVIAVTLTGKPKPVVRVPNSTERPCLVFFSEPYAAWSWRTEEAYRELLPHLSSLAESSGLKLVFKLHPFESVKSHRKLLLRHLPTKQARQIEVIRGLTPESLWQDIRIALTAQSSIAVECADRGIPIFLCYWLRDPFSGYIQQYQRFGVGHVLDTAADLACIPSILQSQGTRSRQKERSPNRDGADILKEILIGRSSPAIPA